MVMEFSIPERGRSLLENGNTGSRWGFKSWIPPNTEVWDIGGKGYDLEPGNDESCEEVSRTLWDARNDTAFMFSKDTIKLQSSLLQ